ncbi:MAG: DNA polymerase I [Firmicutes bacterium]|nr:DNA polymerase I [Bacillota bacterium]
MRVERRLFLIDGNSLINRAFYALPPLTNHRGEPTNAVYGLTMMLLRLKEDYAPEQMVVAFDVSGPTFRHGQFEEYKATRKGMPDDLRTQIPVMKELLDKLGVKRLELQGFEADDLIGTVAKKGENEGYQVYIVTGDRDAFQLISPQTTVLFTKRGITETELVNEQTLAQNYGLTPEQVKDLKGLMGDTSDNIPGVPGVGEKTAMKLLASYGSLEEIYAHLPEIKGKLQERLTEYQDQAFLSKDLATIRLDCPVELDLAQTESMDGKAVREMFIDLGFKTLLERLPEENGAPSAQENESWDDSYRLLDGESSEEFLAQLNQVEKVYLNYAADEQLLYLFLTELWAVDQHNLESRWDELVDELKDKELYATSGKDVLHLFGPKSPVQIYFDLELALYCVDPEQRWDFSAIAHKFNLPGSSLDQKDNRLQVAFVHLLKEVAPLVERQLKDDDLWSLYHEVELPLASVLAKMEAHGILVDPLKLEEISQDLETSLTRLTELIFAEAGEEFNINSPKQLGVILFEKLGLPVLKRTKTGPSTSADVLEELSDHPIVSHVLEYRQVAKLKSTYADALGDLISPQTKRLHTTFNQTVTATGRLSSTHPNLQNIPVRTEEGRRIREAFVVPEGYYLLSADYSQIELRLLAHLSGDEVLLQAFRSGKDIHTQTAAEVFGLAMEDVSPEQRNAAKAINFGIVYGISSFGLAKGINLTRAEAQQYIDSYFLRYPMVKAYLDGAVELGRKQGYVTTLLGRRRYLPNLKSRNFAQRSFAARTAMNSPIQGSAADIIKLAMLKVNRALQEAELDTKLLLQVHDELVFEVPEEELSTVAYLVKAEMEQVIKLDVPLVVDVSYGRNWRDVQNFNFEE